MGKVSIRLLGKAEDVETVTRGLLLLHQMVEVGEDIPNDDHTAVARHLIIEASPPPAGDTVARHMLGKG